MFRLIHSCHQAVYKNKAKIFTVTRVHLKPTYHESVNIHFCSCHKPNDGYILGETCSFCTINKLVCSDRIRRNSSCCCTVHNVQLFNSIPTYANTYNFFTLKHKNCYDMFRSLRMILGSKHVGAILVFLM